MSCQVVSIPVCRSPTHTTPKTTSANHLLSTFQQVGWLLEEGPADADGETLADAVEQFGVEEDVASRILEAEFKSAARQVCMWLIQGGRFVHTCVCMCDYVHQ